MKKPFLKSFANWLHSFSGWTRSLLFVGVSAAIMSLVACGDAVTEKMNDGAFSNGVGGASYFYNSKFVHEKNYGQILDGFYREGLVACAYSEATDKFSVDMYIPEEKDIGSFAKASEGVFLEFVGRGIPTHGDHIIGPNEQSKVHAVLPAKVVQSLHHFSSTMTTSRCSIRIDNNGSSYKGYIDCTDLGSVEVTGRLTVRSNFECKAIEKY